MRQLVRWPRRGDDPYRHVVSIFTKPERALRNLDIALGPCRPAPGRSRPLIGVTRQRPGDPSMYESLAEIMLGTRDRTWQATVTAEQGRLNAFDDAFVEAMAAHNRAFVERKAERPDDFDWMFAESRDIFERWMPDISWPAGATSVPPRASDLGEVCAWARVAQDRGDHLYCWSGPGFNPWVTKDRIDRMASKLTRGNQRPSKAV